MCNHNITSTKNQYFIDKSRKIHGEKYDYSLVEYVNNRTKVKIICPEHGVFEQIPNGHLSGDGCKSCGRISIAQKQASSQKDVISKFNVAHNDRYDYSLVEYVNVKTKVKIICKKHGVFEQLPLAHAKGSGCPKCKTEKLGTLFTWTTNQAIQEFQKIHHDTYDYSKVEYRDSQTDVTIICKDHGEFQQMPRKHLIGQGCPYCGRIKTTKAQSGKKRGRSPHQITKDEYISRATKVFGSIYDYTNVDLVNGLLTEITIGCHIHGDFKKRANKHLLERGCPECSESKQYSKQSQKWLDSLNIPSLVKEYRIPENKLRPVDGYDPTTNTVYQYHGDFFHGNPKLFESEKMNPLLKQKFGDLYQKTLTQDQEIRDYGYNLVIMWEYDWTNNWKNRKLINNE